MKTVHHGVNTSAAYLKSQGPNWRFSIWDALEAAVRDSIVCHSFSPLQSTFFNFDNYSVIHVDVGKSSYSDGCDTGQRELSCATSLVVNRLRCTTRHEPTNT
jgi:hypothetical protein